MGNGCGRRDGRQASESPLSRRADMVSTRGFPHRAPLWRWQETTNYMMTGIVTARREAILRIAIRGIHGNEYFFDAMIDTGYNGWLTLPPAIIAALGLSWETFVRAELADGSESDFNVYEGIVLWDGQPVTIDIDEIDADPLIGMSLLYGYELVLPVLDGATFFVRSLATPLLREKLPAKHRSPF